MPFRLRCLFSAISPRPQGSNLASRCMYLRINDPLIVHRCPKHIRSKHSAARRISTKSSVASVQAQPHLSEIRGESGRVYKIGTVLQDKGPYMGRVFLATNANKRYILKEIPHNNYRIRKDTYNRIGANPHIRGLVDAAPDHSVFVFDYFDDHFLGLVQRNLPLAATKQILKQALQGLAAIHAKDVIHNDIKPNNIFVQTSKGSDGVTVDRAILADLEDSAHCPPPGNLMGAQLGNWMWRSPEAHAEGPMNKPSDVFAFAIVCIYAMTKRVIFHVSQDELAEGEELLAIVLERQLSYFGDADMFAGFLEYLSNANPDNPWIQIFEVVRTGFTAENPREPFAWWEEDPPFDDQFRDLINRMSRFDPRQRITAHEALEHEWFRGV